MKKNRVGLAGACAAALLSVGPGAPAMEASAADPARLAAPTRYDTDYPHIDYAGAATQNRVWQLQQQLEQGRLRLEWRPPFGYLHSLLRALQIDADSQVLVFSSTSLQFSDISATTPRAVYFNDDTYVGYVPGTDFIEIASVDALRGVVFHGLANVQDAPQVWRDGNRCLICHDTYSMTGGGVPRLRVLSTPVDHPDDPREWSAASDTGDRTPLAQRWGGWFVTGDTGDNRHFGNLPLREQKLDAHLRTLRDRKHPSSLEEYIDTSRYLTPFSDVVALLVLEHQVTVQNLVTRAAFKVPQVLGLRGDPASWPQRWAQLSAADQRRAQPMLDALVKALFFHEAAPLSGRIQSSNGFASRFAVQGPRAADGRSLREFDLTSRLFRHGLSFQVHSPQMAALPPFMTDYLYGSIAALLRGEAAAGLPGTMLSDAERVALREILQDTLPFMASRLRPP